MATARAIVETVQAQETSFDAILFGNESADTSGYQVGIRVAHGLDMPCVAGIKSLAVEEDTAVAQRETGSGWETYRVALPAVFTVREGLNLPRYPSLPGKLRAKKKPIAQVEPQRRSGDLEKVGLKTPKEQESDVVILGHGSEAAPKAVAALKELGVV